MQFKPLNTAFIAINEQKVDRPAKQFPQIRWQIRLYVFAHIFGASLHLYAILTCLFHFCFACLCFSVVIRSAFYVSLNHRKLKTYQSRNRMMKFLQITLFYQPFEEHWKLRWIAVILSTFRGLHLRNFRLLKTVEIIFFCLFSSIFSDLLNRFLHNVFNSCHIRWLISSYFHLSCHQWR